ncbi:MAG: hypothetical protein LQ340_007329, partial [Diploschistes diacapsis]
MTSQEPLHYSEEKWEATVNDAYNNLPAEYPTYPCPDPGSTDFAQLIDHTLLKLDATAEQIDKLCEEAREYRFKTVCVRLDWVSRCVANLRGSDVGVACVIDFHKGSAPTAAKV